MMHQKKHRTRECMPCPILRPVPLIPLSTSYPSVILQPNQFNQCCHEALRSPLMYNTWYNVTPVKVKNLSAFIPDICTNVGVKRYTGHSLRSTAITAMSDAVSTDRSIMFMSDHKCEESLKSYCRRPSTDQKYKISSVLDNVATGNSSSSAALVPVAPSNSAAISTLPNNVTETGQSVFTERTPLHSIDIPNHNVLVNRQSNIQTSKLSGFAANSVFQINM
ncbi:unnamed protein product [Mytilus coruscus]|uniref:Tyr recombinase domain-containing protein n=1 Tax=Mytilus coruscus TaxID=42192 RepID=A0A6J8AZ22_MYTCO|nr:unnamed protein product [Mytilus coruscus]